MITTKSKRRIPLLYLLEGIISGAVSALSLPPFGFWILALVGTAAFYMLLQASGPKRRMMIGFGFAVGYFGISYAWVTSLVFGGWIALVIFQMIITGVASLLVPAHRPGRWGTASMFGFATVMVLADQLRWSWPFGGMPIGALSLGQAASPLGQLARIGGPILIELATFLAGACIGELALRSAGLWHDELRHPHLHPQLRRDGKIVAKASNPTRPGEPVAFNLGPIAIAIAIVIVVAIADFVAPDGGHSHSRIRIAAVQGGGARGLHAIFTDADIVFARQLSPTEQIPPMPRIDLVVWPEDVISLSEPVVNSSAGNEVARQARRLDSTLVAGVTQTVGQSKFLNEAVA
ncbi:MAG TPA: hypothetical protein VMU77_00775, partial [Acidimicrobiales bacterium]|nr:hypothetical protein [Acidimicrobiales bacterium]